MVGLLVCWLTGMTKGITTIGYCYKKVSFTKGIATQGINFKRHRHQKLLTTRGIVQNVYHDIRHMWALIHKYIYMGGNAIQ